MKSETAIMYITCMPATRHKERPQASQCSLHIFLGKAERGYFGSSCLGKIYPRKSGAPMF